MSVPDRGTADEIDLDSTLAGAPRALLEEMLAIAARGLTNIEFPLRVAARELAQTASPDARAVLLSDCVHNAGPDPRHAAGALPRCDVVLDASGEHDRELARDLARQGRDHLRVRAGHRPGPCA